MPKAGYKENLDKACKQSAETSVLNGGTLTLTISDLDIHTKIPFATVVSVATDTITYSPTGVTLVGVRDTAANTVTFTATNSSGGTLVLAIIALAFDFASS
jgi:hypothetical protein